MGMNNSVFKSSRLEKETLRKKTEVSIRVRLSNVDIVVHWMDVVRYFYFIAILI